MLIDIFTPMNLFLTSSGLPNQEIIDHFISFAGNVKIVSLITTASDQFKERNWNAIKLKKKFEQMGMEVTFVDIEFEDPSILKSSDLIVIGGGNPYYLLYHLKRSGADKTLKTIIANGRPVMAVSAGFLVLMNDLRVVDVMTPEMNQIKLKDKRALGLIDEILIPHYDRFLKEGAINQRTIDQFEKESVFEVIRLGEHQCVVYRNGGRQIFGESFKTSE